MPPTSSLRSVIQGFFREGRPRIPVVATTPAPVQPRMPGNPAIQPRLAPHVAARLAAHLPPAALQARPASTHPHPLAQSRKAQPREPVPHSVHLQSAGPQNAADPQRVVQRLENGEAFQLPANLANFGFSGGQALPDPVRQKMESFFGQSFADVRVHVGPQASSIGALAFTHGSNLYFAPGQYNPNSAQGQQLLGHELTHVVQQRAGRVRNPFASGIAVVQDRGLEAEAERMGLRAASHVGPSVPATPVQAKTALPAKAQQHPGSEQVLQPGRTKITAPKALRYRSFTGKRRIHRVEKFKKVQYNLRRGRRLHVRHIIPHSDLQAWMLCARMAGGAGSAAGQMRRRIYALLVRFGEQGEADTWEDCYDDYEQNGLGSLLQYDAAGVARVWNVIEWHHRNLFLGHAGLNTAIQNRFDAGRGAVAYRGQVYINALHAIWYGANTLLALAPTAIQETTVYSTWLQAYVIVHAAEHNNSRNLVAAVGRIHRSDYLRLAP